MPSAPAGEESQEGESPEAMGRLTPVPSERPFPLLIL